MENNKIHSFSATVVEIEGGFMGIVKEIPGAISFAKTKDSLKVRLESAISLIQSYNRANIESKTKYNLQKASIDLSKTETMELCY